MNLDPLIRIYPQEPWPRPASASAVRGVEERFDLVLPDELRAFYLAHDGTPGHCDVDHGWMRIWALSEWEPPPEGCRHAAMFADYGISSDEYFFEGARESPTFCAVFVCGANVPRQVAANFSEFIALIVAGDTGRLW